MAELSLLQLCASLAPFAMIPIGSLFFYVGRGIQKIVRPGQTAAKERPAESQVEEQDRAPRKVLDNPCF